MQLSDKLKEIYSIIIALIRSGLKLYLPLQMWSLHPSKHAQFLTSGVHLRVW